MSEEEKLHFDLIRYFSKPECLRLRGGKGSAFYVHHVLTPPPFVCAFKLPKAFKKKILVSQNGMCSMLNP